MNRMLTTKEWQESLAEAFHNAVKSACQDLIDEAVKAEREACAKMCEGRTGGAAQSHDFWEGFRTATRQCAAAIRARSTS